jgi:hypothetical protein
VKELGILLISLFSWFVIISKFHIFFSAIVDSGGGGRGGEGVVWKVDALPLPCYIVL